jgi:phenylalanyl-tRNA synthetase alpha chain
MEQELEQIKQTALAELRGIGDAAALEDARVKYLGKKSRLKEVSAGMRELTLNQKKVVGKALSTVSKTIESAIDDAKQRLQSEADAKSLSAIDATLPGFPMQPGALHPVTQIQDLAINAFRRMGFAMASGPEIETEFHCFDALNTPPEHPARNEQDTFYFEDGRLLRTHTSSVQIRTMESTPPPVRIIAPGSAFRRDDIDGTHLPQFTQLEGLYVAEDVSLADLKGTLEMFFQIVFDEDIEVRFRPHFFPFTEPSFEIDVMHSERGWIEVAGCGMVDPAVFEQMCQSRGDRAYAPNCVTGFAFGMGIERLAMILFGVPDIRKLIENDQRFLRQFA